MTDIVERLRYSSDQLCEIGGTMADEHYGRLLGEAAAEIERLRAALQKSCGHMEWMLRFVQRSGSGDAAGVYVNAREFIETARAALEVKE